MTQPGFELVPVNISCFLVPNKVEFQILPRDIQNKVFFL